MYGTQFQLSSSCCLCFYCSASGIPGDYNRLTKDTLRFDECPAYGCMLELTIQVAIFMVGKQILNNGLEILTPYISPVLSKLWRAIQKKRGKLIEEEEPIYTRWEKDYDLKPPPEQSLFPEYLELGLFHEENVGIPGPYVKLRECWNPRPLQLRELCCIRFCFFSPYSHPVWFHHHLCGGLSPGSILCSPQQLDRDQAGRSQVHFCLSQASPRPCPGHRQASTSATIGLLRNTFVP